MKFYDGNKLLSYNKTFNFSLGNRSTGKSFFWKCFCINKWLKCRRKFIYIRRYDNELDYVKNWFDDVAFKFPDLEFKVDKDMFYINDEVCGYAVALSIAYKLKGVSFVDVDLLFYDEFLSETSRYLKREVDMAMGFYQTVSRGDGKVIRPEVKFIFVANSVSVNNPYFNDLGIVIKSNSCYTKGNGYVVEIYQNDEIKNEIEDSDFGKLIKGTKYGNYALNNAFYLDDNTYIEPMKSGYKYYMTLRYYGKDYAVYLNDNEGLFHINQKVDNSYPFKYCFTTSDHAINYILIEKKKKTPKLNLLRFGYENGCVRFDSPKSKAMFYDVMNYNKLI